MTFTALNIVSVAVAVLLVGGLLAAYLHLRRKIADAEGAIAITDEAGNSLQRENAQ